MEPIVARSVSVFVDLRTEDSPSIRVQADRLTCGAHYVWILRQDDQVLFPLAQAESVADALRAVAERYRAEIEVDAPPAVRP